MNKDEKAVALGYNTGDLAPKILASVKGELVKILVEIAEKNSIPIYKDADLVEVLSALDVGSIIPEVLYKAIAEVLAYCYKVNSKFKEKISIE